MNMINRLDNFELDISCKKCGNVTKKPIGWVKANSHLICGCGTVIAFDSGELAARIIEINDYLCNLEQMQK
ncbi:MAG TPA: hypothetical protein VLG17_19625 [Pseudomonas sp.]|uniref:hypothetical protein n=1 Tax=Pseudomonas sp. TaxID=306 RepID=UPI002BFA7A8A|nr:hypothetical protein [Pseudomonas sp.]HSX90192.1 hypothetical protein [Pseudomonas sp.]